MLPVSPDKYWRSFRPSDSPIGVTSLAPIVFAVIVWPLCVVISGREQSFQLAMNGIAAVCYIAFMVGILGSLYSLLQEKSKIFGSVGMMAAAYALFLHPESWDFRSLIAFYLPLVVFLLLLFVVARVSEKHHCGFPRH